VKRFFYICVSLSFLLCQCKKNHASAPVSSVFDSVPLVRPLSPVVNEISGIADSKVNPGFIWAQEDSGNPPQLYLINHSGRVEKTIYLKGIANRDWEDMALFNDEIYIAETGDNSLSYTNYAFYKFAEPSSATDTVKNFETIHFTYPDGAHDAEAFLIDPVTKNIYIITKRDNPSKLYRLSYPYASNNTVSFVDNLPYSGVTSAAISADGKEWIIKTYTNLFYYKRSPGESVETSFKKNYISLPYTVEPQGEALTFAIDGSGFYTISEKGLSSSVNVYYYKRH
jgi:hypothetical protein